MATTITFLPTRVLPLQDAGKSYQPTELPRATAKVLRFIQDYFKTADAMPTVRDIMRYMGFRSTNSVYKHIKKLERAGKIYKTQTGRLTFQSTGAQQLPFMGKINAGFAAPVEEAQEFMTNLDEFMIANPSRTFLLRVNGDSMVDAGILDGDYVLVERTQQAKSGQIVVACIDDGFTLKYYMHEQGKTFLRAANSSYEDFYPQKNMTIFGVVVGTLRKYAQ